MVVHSCNQNTELPFWDTWVSKSQDVVFTLRLWNVRNYDGRVTLSDLMVCLTLYFITAWSARMNTYFLNLSQVKVNEILWFSWYPSLYMSSDLLPCKRTQDIIASQYLLMRPREVTQQPGQDFIQLQEWHTRGTMNSQSLTKLLLDTPKVWIVLPRNVDSGINKLALLWADFAIMWESFNSNLTQLQESSLSVQHLPVYPAQQGAVLSPFLVLSDLISKVSLILSDTL